MVTKKQSAEYERSVSQEALERQARLAKERFICCGQPRDEGHHEMCSLRPQEPEGPVEGQTSLL